MNWLDLGWLKRGDAWEFHPWGPFSRGYLLSENEMETARWRMRWIRAAMVVLVALAIGMRMAIGNWWPSLGVCVVGGVLEALLTWWVVKGFRRTELSMGWENGLVYLAQWGGPKLLTLARMASVVLVAMALLLVVKQPTHPGPYLLVGAFVAMQFVLNYLEQVQRN